VVAAPAPRWEALRALAQRAGFATAELVEGGERRQDSVARALERCSAHELVCVHDAARPLAPPGLYREVVRAAELEGAAIPALPCVDTIKRVADGHVVETVARRTVFAAQTPQAFRRELLQRAHAAADRESLEASDDAMLVEHLGEPVTVVDGDARNLKVTRPEDVALLLAHLGRS
jgi:2-C-methyl-D-erythritol 4-phosphate cytidylyltransferase